MHFAQKLLTNVQYNGGYKFCKGDESLDDKECSGQLLEGDRDQMRGSWELTLSQLHEKLLKNSGRPP